MEKNGTLALNELSELHASNVLENNLHHRSFNFITTFVLQKK